MENKQTAVEQLIDCIPSATEIMDYIHDYQPDEKMLDNWLWERIYKDREWVKMEKEQIIDSFRNGLDDFYDKDTSFYENGEKYYNQTYKQQDKCSPSAHAD
jgi:hypothetical protein